MGELDTFKKFTGRGKVWVGVRLLQGGKAMDGKWVGRFSFISPRLVKVALMLYNRIYHKIMTAQKRRESDRRQPLHTFHCAALGNLLPITYVKNGRQGAEING